MIFLWRFCRNTVPVKNRLLYKGVAVPIECSMCEADVEHMLHIFFDCDFAKNCWNSVGMKLYMDEVEFTPDWLLERLSIEPHEKLITIVTVPWSLWFARNKRVWEGVVLSPTIAIALGSKHITD